MQVVLTAAVFDYILVSMYNPGIIYQFGWVLPMLRIALILLCLLSTTANADAQRTRCQQRHCIAIVDAGSTGSRVYVYAYDLDLNKTPIKVDKLWSNKIKPGIANIEPKNIDAYLTHLFAQAPEQNIPVYFYATGGMRLVSQPKQQLHYNVIQKWFSTQSQWTLLDAKTITGKQEAIFGWLALNYKLGALQSTEIPLASVMDMGGASVQIAIPVEHTEAINHQNIVQIDVYDRHIKLFVHSFLGLGQTELSHHYFNNASCFPNEYPLPNEGRGQGDALTCQHDISKLINSVHDVNHIINPVITANPVITWYTLSGLGRLVKNKPFVFDNNQFTDRNMLKQANNELCKQSWQTLSTKYADTDYTYINCLTSAYYYALIVNGYGLQPDQVVNYMSDDDEPDWTLGAVLTQNQLS